MTFLTVKKWFTSQEFCHELALEIDDISYCKEMVCYPGVIKSLSSPGVQRPVAGGQAGGDGRQVRGWRHKGNAQRLRHAGPHRDSGVYRVHAGVAEAGKASGKVRYLLCNRGSGLWNLMSTKCSFFNFENQIPPTGAEPPDPAIFLDWGPWLHLFSVNGIFRILFCRHYVCIPR